MFVVIGLHTPDSAAFRILFNGGGGGGGQGKIGTQI